MTGMSMQHNLRNKRNGLKTKQNCQISMRNKQRRPSSTNIFNLPNKDSPAVLHAGAWLPEVNSIFTGTLVLELKALMVREHS